jgi:large subunit ribosomal protein L30e
MVDQQILGRVLKEAMKGGKFTLGTKEVISEIKSSKVVVAASSIAGAAGAKLKLEAEKNNVPVVILDKNSAQLGKLLGRPYKVSAIALRQITESDLRQIQA